MDFRSFERLALEAFEAIPPEFRAGIDGLEVSRRTVPHPSLPDIYTLGECITEEYPSEFGGVGDVRSLVVLYHGSFVALSRLDEGFDWEEEIWETVTHEVRHHLEWQAAEDGLEVMDYVEDQNFARREGRAFDPFFYRAGIRRGDAAWEVDGDVFLEVALPKRGPAEPVVVRWRGRRYRVPVPRPLGDVHFVPLAEDETGGEVLAVLVRERGWRDSLRALLRPRPLDVRTTGLEGEWSRGGSAGG